MEARVEQAAPQPTDELQALEKKRKHRRILEIALVVAILAAAVVKYILYFLPERVTYDKRAVPVAETQVDTSALFTMPFNGELVTACQEKLFVDSRDRTAALDFFSAQTNRVLVRAEIFTDMDNLNRRPIRKFWTKLLYPEDERLVRIGATGWVQAGEIIENLKLDELPMRSCEAVIRFSAVNPANTSISGGMFSLHTDMYIVDYEGKMLDETGQWVDAG